MDIAFEELFSLATGQNIQPYPYQTELALKDWPDILNAPTSSGKMSAVTLSWLFKRLQDDPDTPRRLVYCLPMRTLVEQAVKNINNWLENLKNSGKINSILNKIPTVSILMGGRIDKDWDQYPERNTILIGTQDQLLSRALNRVLSASPHENHQS